MPPAQQPLPEGDGLYLEAECPTSAAGGFIKGQIALPGYAGAGHLTSIDSAPTTVYDGSSADVAGFGFDVSPGSYRIYLRLNSGGVGTSDSFFYRVDARAWERGRADAEAVDWRWAEVESGPFELGGQHTLELANREGGLGFDRIAVLVATEPPPSGLGYAANNCACDVEGDCAAGSCVSDICEPALGTAFHMSGHRTSISASSYDDAVATAGSGWIQSGTEMVLASTNDAKLWLVPGTGPRLSYLVEFTATDLFYLHLYAQPQEGSPALFVGIDSVPAAGPLEFTSREAAWRTQPVDIGSRGRHSVDVWARENGITLKKIVINRTPEPPMGVGPVESPRL